MSQDHSGDLIERIRHHCQQTAWDAQHLERQRRWLVEPTEDYNGWYIPDRRSFIALAQGSDGQEPSLAFPPATEEQLQETEALLGFALPPLLRLLYTGIANGGFGPGYGIIGALEGFPLEGGMGEDIAHCYLLAIQGCTLIHLEDFEMFSWAQRDHQLKQLPSEQVLDWVKQPLPLHDPSGQESPEWEQRNLYEFPHGVWPERLLPLCDWGCGIGSFIDARTERIFQVYASDRGWHYILEYRAASLEEWLERWLSGEMLQ